MESRYLSYYLNKAKIFFLKQKPDEYTKLTSRNIVELETIVKLLEGMVFAVTGLYTRWILFCKCYVVYYDISLSTKQVNICKVRS